ncbi:VOC family protein [Roseibium salinum]|uniref:VOC family protein n=1 Tax=Roseibium salinum TaxID=1604349 RepID=A0ABT3R463_9HYPH|nr:VOC family protein [Roseibium sp. DSM 29163]MCX2723931.1 VOC family protein [Roseibium sp. DSM 29163]
MNKVSVDFNHTIVWSRDKNASAAFLTEILGLPSPRTFSHFRVVTTGNGVNIDFLDTDAEITPQHYAFLVSESEFDEIFKRIRERSMQYWADPAKEKPGEINRRDGGRGLYFDDPDGHSLEILTRPYGSGG